MVSVNFGNVSKRYEDGFEAVKGLNLEVNDGEFLVLLGPSGCGKSTTLRMWRDSRRSRRRDQHRRCDRESSPAGARGLGMVFQSYALYPHMTVRDNLTFGLRMVKGKDRLTENEMASRVKEAATMLELDDHLDKKPKELSGGQRQRWPWACAYSTTEGLLMDEPLSNLDAELRHQMRHEIRRLHDELGTTTIYVTHDQIEAMTLADRVAILDGGVLQQHARRWKRTNIQQTNLFSPFCAATSMIWSTRRTRSFVLHRLQKRRPEPCEPPPVHRVHSRSRCRHALLSNEAQAAEGRSSTAMTLTYTGSASRPVGR